MLVGGAMIGRGADGSGDPRASIGARVEEVAVKAKAWPGLLALAVLSGVLVYTTSQWGGVVTTGRYGYLLVLGLLAAVWSLFRRRIDAPPEPEPVLRWALRLLPVYVFLQLVPLPLAVLRLLSPARAALLDTLSPVGAGVAYAPLSVYPEGAFQYWLLLSGYLLIFLMVRELSWTLEGRPWLLAWPFVVLAALEAALGMWQFFGAADGTPRGTYASRDHFAGFLEMALPFAVMYPIAVLHRARPRRVLPVRSALKASLLWAAAGLVLAGIIYSFSRLGFAAAMTSFSVMALLVAGERQLRWVAETRTRRVLAMALVLVLVLVSFLLLPPQKLIARFNTEELKTDDRIELVRETLPVIRAYPLFGCGLGGYESVFYGARMTHPLYTDEFAHNDYLQLLLELGAVGFLIGIVLAGSILRKAVTAVRGFPGPDRRCLAVACLGSFTAILVHSMGDFNLYIPANAMLIAWIAGITEGLSFDTRDRNKLRRFGLPQVIAVRPSR